MPRSDLQSRSCARSASLGRGGAFRLIRADGYDAVRPTRAARSDDTPVRVLIIPGLRNSGPDHWQTWLQSQYRDAVRVEPDDWEIADLERWSQTIRRTVRSHPSARWIAVAHSFGCLALARYLMQDGERVASALLVAPADPKKFAVTDQLPLQPLNVHCHLIGSRTDPWMRLENASAWALLWAARFIDLGNAGHINTESGFGPFPLANSLVNQMLANANCTKKPWPSAWSAYSFAV